jgi:hypothetical protein
VAGPGGDVEIRWPADVTVRFTPAVELARRGQIVARAGQRVASLETAAVSPNPHCPLPAQHRAVEGGEPQLNPGTPRPS